MQYWMGGDGWIVMLEQIEGNGMRWNTGEVVVQRWMGEKQREMDNNECMAGGLGEPGDGDNSDSIVSVARLSRERRFLGLMETVTESGSRANFRVDGKTQCKRRDIGDSGVVIHEYTLLKQSSVLKVINSSSDE